LLKKKHLKTLLIVASLCYPFLIHYLIVTNQFLFAGFYIIGLMMMITMQNILLGNKMVVAVVFSLCIITIALLFYNVGLVIMLPPILIPLAWAYIFGISLLENRTACITIIAQKIRNNKLDKSEKIYTRLVTKIWFIFFIAIAIESVIVAILFDFETWSYITNFVNYILIVLFMLAEFTLRKYMLHNITHTTFIAFIKQLILVQRKQ